MTPLMMSRNVIFSSSSFLIYSSVINVKIYFVTILFFIVGEYFLYSPNIVKIIFLYGNHFKDKEDRLVDFSETRLEQRSYMIYDTILRRNIQIKHQEFFYFGTKKNKYVLLRCIFIKIKSFSKYPQFKIEEFEKLPIQHQSILT